MENSCVEVSGTEGGGGAGFLNGGELPVRTKKRQHHKTKNGTADDFGLWPTGRMAKGRSAAANASSLRALDHK